MMNPRNTFIPIITKLFEVIELNIINPLKCRKKYEY